MKIAIAQTNIAFENQTENLSCAFDWIAQAAENHADCILFPEMSFTGFSMHTEVIAPLSVQAIAEMRQLAKKYVISIGFGYVAANEDGSYGNHYMLCNAKGTPVLDYVKIHPFSYSGEDRFYRGGTEIMTAKLCDIPVSVLICYDLRFPEVFRLAAKKASLILVPANWLDRRSIHWQLLLRARAIENQVYVLGINCVGMQQQYHFLGNSCLVNPEGELLVSCGSDVQLLYAEIQDDVIVFQKNFPTKHDAQFAWYAEQYQTHLTPKQT